MKKELYILIASSFFIFNANSYALPLFTQSECVTHSSKIQNWPNWGSNIYSSGQSIYYYIEQDFGRELKNKEKTCQNFFC